MGISYSVSTRQTRINQICAKIEQTTAKHAQERLDEDLAISNLETWIQSLRSDQERLVHSGDGGAEGEKADVLQLEAQIEDATTKLFELNKERHNAETKRSCYERKLNDSKQWVESAWCCLWCARTDDSK